MASDLGGTRRQAPYVDDFRRIAARRGKHIATVAIARKLLSRVFYVLRELEGGRSDEPGEPESRAEP